jgi:threonine dehydratase
MSVVAVEPDTAACLSSSLTTGKPVTVRTSSTIMDGMDLEEVRTVTGFPVVKLEDKQAAVSGSTATTDMGVLLSLTRLPVYLLA